MLQHSLRRTGRAIMVAAAATTALLTVPFTASAEEPAASDTVDELLAACPLDGAADFVDSWGWARSGGRSHEGVDMIADRGTPVVAVRDGDAHFKQNRLGGNAVWLTAPNGDKFYYAHLDAFAGESRAVRAGEVLGFVGSTGNAQGPHLHFETLPVGNVENPYPHTLAACVPTTAELDAMFAAAANALNDPTLWERFVPTP